MKTISTLVLLPLLSFGQSGYILNGELENGSFVPVEVTDGYQVVYDTTDASGSFQLDFFTDSFSYQIMCQYVDCDGYNQVFGFGGETSYLYGGGVYCVEMSNEFPPYQIQIQPNGALGLIPSLNGVHFKVFDSFMSKRVGGYNKWSSGLYYVQAFKGKELIGTYQIYKTQ